VEKKGNENVKNVEGRKTGTQKQGSQWNPGWAAGFRKKPIYGHSGGDRERK